MYNGGGNVVETLSETGNVQVSAQYVCHLLNVRIVQERAFQFRCATISRIQMERLFGEERCDRYYKWLPGAASHFHAIVKNFCMSLKLPRLRSEVLATQPSPLFHAVSGGHIVANASLIGYIDGGVMVQMDTIVYVLPSSAQIAEPSLIFMPSEWLSDSGVN